MFPLQDLNPTRRLPIFTYILIGINVLVFLWEISLPAQELERQFFNLAVVPSRIAGSPFAVESFLDIIRSMFLHGGWDHIIGNMLYLYLFGDNIEDRFGAIWYLLLYFLCGFIASYAQVYIDPTSQIPNIGASGAIAGVLGAYLVLYPGVKVRGLILLGGFGRLTELPAYIVLGFWFVLQLINGFASLGAASYGGGVAFFAHIGGFVGGVVLAFVFKFVVPQPPADARNEMLYERSQGRRF